MNWENLRHASELAKEERKIWQRHNWKKEWWIFIWSDIGSNEKEFKKFLSFLSKGDRAGEKRGSDSFKSEESEEVKTSLYNMTDFSESLIFD